MKNKLVSVVVPVYNAENYIGECIESLCNQTLKEIEIICVDDMSTDGSIEIIKKFQEKDSRITLIYNDEQSEGAALARNIGIKASQGDYLAIVDADDFFEVDMLEKSYKMALLTGADIVMFDALYYDDVRKMDYKPTFSVITINERFLPKEETFSPIDNSDNMFLVTHGAAWGKLFKRDLVLNNNIQFISGRSWDDIIFTYVALCSARKIALLRERLLHYRWNAVNNQTSNRAKYPEVGYRIPYLLKNEFEKRGLYETFKKGLINCTVSRAIGLLNMMDSSESFDELFYALKNSYLELIGAYDIEDDEYFDKYILWCRDCIHETDSSEAYLIKKGFFHVEQKRSFEVRLAEMTKGKTNIAIYGAGKRGTDLFGKVFSGGIYNIVTWVDRKYGLMGYPIEDPDSLCKKIFDYVIVAIEDENIFFEVKKYLLKMNIPEEKILWMY